jgi:5'-deoxynucleotidase YfbR-like HD superfamily hydrolase
MAVSADVQIDRYLAEQGKIAWEREVTPLWPVAQPNPAQLDFSKLRVYDQEYLRAVGDIGRYPAAQTALQVFRALGPDLILVPRWANYARANMGDMTVGHHTMRQSIITAHALGFDQSHFALSPMDADLMLAASLGHDIGELFVGDLTYDLKQASKKEMDIAETRAVFKLIDADQRFYYLSQDEKQVLKDAYIRITTSLTDAEIKELYGDRWFKEGEVHYPALNMLFGLYERYGYLITALQEYPYDPSKRQGFSREYLHKLRTWNRPELEAAIKRGERVDPNLKAMMLFKNVILNQWGKIRKAMEEGVPSAERFFVNGRTAEIVKHANVLLQANLDLECF